MERWCSRNSAVTTAQMECRPRSSGPVEQQPSREKPARRLDPTLDGQHPAVDGGDHRGVVGFGLVGVAPGECA